MAQITVRGATLDDTLAISALFRAGITTWQRLDASGQVQDVPYDLLTIYERWLHGGAWMSVETGALHLSHLLRGAGYAAVALRDDTICAYGEAFAGNEPAPYGPHLHMTPPTIHENCAVDSVEAALVAYWREQAAARRLSRLTVSCALDAQRAFYSAQGFTLLATIQRHSLPARTGQGFYRVSPHDDPDPAQIHGWSMPIGRTGSARQMWETLWPRTWDALPEIAAQRTYRLSLNAAGQEALLYCQQQLYAPRTADVSCWSPRPLTKQLLTAIRDWAHREGFRTLILPVDETTAKLLGPEAEADAYRQEHYAAQV